MCEIQLISTNYTMQGNTPLPSWIKVPFSQFYGYPVPGDGEGRVILSRYGIFQVQWSYESPSRGSDDQGEAWVVEADSTCLLAPSPFPSPWDCPIRGNVFAVSIFLDIAVTWAVWLMVQCEMTLCLLLSGIGNRNSPIHTPHSFLTFTPFHSPSLEHLSQVVSKNWRWGSRLVCPASCIWRRGVDLDTVSHLATGYKAGFILQL